MCNKEIVRMHMEEVVEEHFSGKHKTFEEAFNAVKARHHLEVRAKLRTDIRNIKGLEEFMRGDVGGN